ncbi:MAG: hypothetical protein FWG41_06325, partial [Methanomassiliicoccaceae archaeon]|nr:hypothetical protein [Methanomassiliicoccaceae archaeon]
SLVDIVRSLIEMNGRELEVELTYHFKTGSKTYRVVFQEIGEVIRAEGEPMGGGEPLPYQQLTLCDEPPTF